MKYIEFGLGNTWFIRTETESTDGTEYEEKGIQGPINFQSLYIRIWIGKTVFILDSKEGYKRLGKNQRNFKIVFGIVSNTE
ncbi:DUF3977 family protein [Bacillus sp. JJ1122]|uniref:DUF3977 family protein n=1 Tax=Bacillus sp. JJ1122 TaxID=3122951 RepID=UPI002FFF09B5